MAGACGSKLGADMKIGLSGSLCLCDRAVLEAYGGVGAAESSGYLML